LERGLPGVTVEGPEYLDPTRRSGRVRLEKVSVSDDDILPGAHDSALARARTLLAAEAVGGSADCVDAAVDYAKVRHQFGRTIATFQAIKHHCANMLVATESAIAAVWDASRAASEDEDQFRLAAASAAALAFPAYARNSELNIQVHGGIGFTWEHDAHLHLRRALVTTALFGGDAPADDVFERTAAGVARENSLDLPPEAEEMRTRIRADVAELAALDKQAQRDKLIETGYVMPHWPKPWGLAADAVEQLVIEEEFRAAGIKRTDYGITAWVILTLVQHGTPWQIERFVEKALRKDEIWCQLFSEPDAGSDAASIKTKATRVDGGWKINGQKVWTSGAHYCARGLATVRTDPEAPKHAGITTVIVDMNAPEVEVRPLRQITGGSDFNEVFFNDLFVPDEDVVGEPNTGWTVARATLGNERVSIGGSGSFYAGLATQLVEQIKAQPDRLAGGRTRVGRYLAEENVLRLLNLRRVARSVEGAGPGPEGNVTKLKLSDHMIEGGAITAALAGPAVALLDGDGALPSRLVMSARAMAIAGGTSEVTRNQIAERILGMPRDPLIN
jgi:alkylation response protein AidB-like acyl-CoA dehydrogenase